MPNIVIIGSGPAGVSAALYTARAGVETTVLTKGPGALDRAAHIQNYYGFAEPISGAELERRGIEGARALGVQFVSTEAVGLTYTDKLTVETLAGEFPADAVILATGGTPMFLPIPGLDNREFVKTAIEVLRGRTLSLALSRRRHRGQPLAADLVAGLKDGHLVAALGSAVRRSQTGDTGAGDKDLLGLGHDGQVVLRLAAGPALSP